MKVRGMTIRVLVSTFLSIYVSIAGYSLLLPGIFVLDAAGTAEFWRKMFLVVNIVGPIATFCVYLFYRPVARVLAQLDRGETPEDKACAKAQRAFKSIEGFLFMIGASAYLLGVMLNMALDLAKGMSLDKVYWFYRIVLALSFGVINGIITARMVNLAWIEAKYRMGITEFADERKRTSTLVKLGMPLSLLVVILMIFGASSVLYYAHRGGADLSLFELEKAIPHFLKNFGILAAIALAIVLALLVENQAHIRHLQTELMALSSGSMDLSSRIFIVSFDDMGYMTAGVNRILEQLRASFITIRKSESEVSSTGEQTRSLVERSRDEATRINELIARLEDSERVEVDVINGVVADFEALVASINETIAKSREQSDFIAKASFSMRTMTQSFKGVSTKAVGAAERFKGLSKDIAEGERGVSELVNANRSMIEANAKIREMASMIMDISERSSLLAMNAAIEAAHAGSAGKGFAVVADEVRKLSSSTAVAARDIDQYVRHILETNEVVENLNERIATVFKSVVLELGEATRGMDVIAASAMDEAAAAEHSLKEIEQLIALTEQMKQNAGAIEDMRGLLTKGLEKLSGIVGQMTEVNENMIDGMGVITELFAKLGASFDGTFNAIEALNGTVTRYKV
jgi:methyl-accepting chemotaxis protein